MVTSEEDLALPQGWFDEIRNAREEAMRKLRPCPSCESRQVQMITIQGPRWRCRICKHRWEG